MFATFYQTRSGYLGVNMPHSRTHIRRQLYLASRPGRRGQIRHVAVGICALLLGSCDWGPERWEPYVLDVAYDRNGQTGILPLDKSSVILEINDSDHLTMRSFTLKMLPVQRTKSGGIISIRVRDLPLIRQSDLNILVRVSATPRKLESSGPCWALKERITTDWKPAEAEAWRLTPAHPWAIAPVWDEIRINVAFRQAEILPNVEAPIEEHTINDVMLAPSSTLADFGITLLTIFLMR
jgi:hypothetical protein